MSSELIQQSINARGARGIARGIEEAVTAGRLEPGTALPSVRALARDLAVSPATVSAAYQRLRDRGVVVTAERQATRVSHRPPLATATAAPLPPGTTDLSSGNPDPRLLPDLTEALRGVEAPPRLYGEATNLDALLEAARGRLGADGVDVSHLVVTSGALDALERILTAHLRPGDRVAVEDPCWSGVLDLLRVLGLRPEPVRIDDAGPRPEALERALGSGVAGIVLTPRAQNPTGAAITAERASELAGVLAAHPEPLLLLDDHAGEVAGAPLPTLPTDRPAWAHVRSVSKTLGPDLRCAVAAGDARTMARVEGHLRHAMRWVSHILQRLVAWLWSSPETEALLATAAEAYRVRREALIGALARRGISAHGASGLNVWVPVPEEAAALASLWRQGWAVAAGERFRLASPPAVRVTVAALDEGAADAVAEALAAGADPALGTTPA